MADLASLRTKVRNSSGLDEAIFFGFLGPHGVTLAKDEYYTFVGDLKSLVAGNPRKEKALNAALQEPIDPITGLGTGGDPYLAIITDPLHVHLDSSNDEVKAVATAGGTIGVADLDWGAYDTVTGHA